MLEGNAKPATQDDEKIGFYSDLYSAFYNSTVSKIRSLVETSVFMISAGTGNIEIIQFLLERSAKIDIQEVGLRAFMLATYFGHVEVIDLLLQKGVKPDYQFENTALIIAVYYSHIEVVKLLLEKGANPNYLQNEDGFTALTFAILNTHVEIVKLLLEKDANPNLQNKDGMTNFMVATASGHIEIVKLLLAKNANPDLQTKHGETALMMAITEGKVEVVKLLLNIGVNFNIQNIGGLTPLIAATIKDRIEIVKLLLEKNAKTEIQIKDVSTAFNIMGKDEINIITKKNGKHDRLIAQNLNGLTAPEIAKIFGHYEILELLLKKEKETDLLNLKKHVVIVNSQSDEIAKFLADESIIPTVQDNREIELFTKDTYSSHAETKRPLLDNGFNFTPKKDESTAFFMTVAIGLVTIFGIFAVFRKFFKKANANRIENNNMQQIPIDKINSPLILSTVEEEAERRQKIIEEFRPRRLRPRQSP